MLTCQKLLHRSSQSNFSSDFQTPGIHGESNIASSPEINVDITIDKRRAVLTLDNAIEAVLAQKTTILKAAESSALYVRCIKELMEINASNTAKIHSYHFRWNPIKAFDKFYRNRLALKLPYSDLHKAYAAVHLDTEQEVPSSSTASPTVPPMFSPSSHSPDRSPSYESKERQDFS